MTLTGIQSLTMDDVRAMIALAMRSGLDSSVLDDFVASIDWSAHDSSVPAVREALGRIEGWSTAYHEGDMSVGEYAMSLIAVLLERESPLRA